MRKLLVVTCTLALTVSVAACGGDDKKSDTAATSTPVATAAVATDTGATDTGGTVDAAVQQAVDACKQGIDANPSVKADVKADLKSICEKAANGDAKSVQEATKEVCTKLVESSVPAGAAQDQAKQACEAVGK